MATTHSDPHDLESSSHEKREVIEDEDAREKSHGVGKWTFNRVVAVTALCIAYVGKIIQHST